MVRYSTLLGAAGVASAIAVPKSGAHASTGLTLRAAPNNTVANPIPISQITNQNIHLGPDNVLNSTGVYSAQAAPTNPITINFVNNFAGGDVTAYVVGLDDSGLVTFWGPNGSHQPQNPETGNPAPVEVDQSQIAIKLGATGSTTPLTLPAYLSSGRIYFAGGGSLYFGVNHGDAGPSLVQPSALAPSDPSANVNWGFSEFTWNAAQLFANISFVDFVGLVAALTLQSASGASQEVKGLPATAITTLCQDLNNQAGADGQIWDQTCIVDSAGQPLRVLAPNTFTASGQGFQDYWTQYVDEVYTSFTSSNPLTINTQGEAGNVQGVYNSATDQIEFATGGNFPRPTAADIFGCNSGPFANSGDGPHLAIVARLCAAFNRSTLKLDGGAEQPNGVAQDQYYPVTPTNYYSKFVHAQEIDGRGYAFSYDDVVPDGGQDLAGAVFAGDATSLTVTVGGVTA